MSLAQEISLSFTMVGIPFGHVDGAAHGDQHGAEHTPDLPRVLSLRHDRRAGRQPHAARSASLVLVGPAIGRGSAHGLTYRLLDDVVAFQSGVTSDDIVIVAVHRPA